MKRRNTVVSHKVVHYGLLAVMIGAAVLLARCTDFVRIDIPNEVVSTEVVFKNDSAATAAVRGIYSYLMQGGTFAGGDNSSVTYVAGLSSDEFTWVLNFMEPSTQAIDENLMSANDPYMETIWSSCYKAIYYVNTILEGLATNRGVSQQIRTRLEGEVKIVRAFSYFYLVNLYGKVPVVLTTNYEINARASRDPVDTVYSRIEKDLLSAIESLQNYPGGKRTRPGLWAAHALLARVYLYTRQWARADEHASAVINSGTYELEQSIDNVFLSGSHEAIWQLKPIYQASGMGTFEALFYPYIPMLNPDVMTWFEENDQRLGWTGETLTETGEPGYYMNKYRVQYLPPDGSVTEEYSMVLRLAEQYLIRAEARAQQQNIGGAIADIDVIRKRAGLPLFVDVNPAPDQAAMIAAIRQEWRIEYLGEWGMRWLELKRTGQVDAVMKLLKPDTWQPTDALYPIPLTEILNDDNLLPQNDGY